MQTELLRSYLEAQGKTERHYRRIIQTMTKLQRYLAKQDKTVDHATPADLLDFLAYYTTTYTTKLQVNDIVVYYQATENKEMQGVIGDLQYQFTPPFLLKELLDIDPAHITALAKLGIKTNNQLLRVGATPRQRMDTAKDCGVPLAVIEKLAKLSDLTRIFALKAVRAKLYYDSGVDTVGKLAQWEPMKLIRMLRSFVEKTEFPGIATLPKEAEHTVRWARKLPKILRF